ncbi:hypothetical protein I4U23_015823 [Adineta vaga]|nr:hypothetical protein I4U23_015823 [Adineta vaga]
MEAFFLSLLSICVIQICSARSYSRGSSGSGSLSTEAIIGIAVGGGVFFIILIVVSIVCTIMQVKRQKVAQAAILNRLTTAQGGNPYAPPGFSQAVPSNQLPLNNQPPPYSTYNNQTQPTKMTPVW